MEMIATIIEVPDVGALLEWLFKLPLWVDSLHIALKTMLMVWLVGSFLKFSRSINNSYIPWVIVVVGPLSYVGFKYGIGVFLIEGLIYTFIAWMAHRFLYKSGLKLAFIYIGNKFPFLKRIFPFLEKDAEFDTDVISRGKTDAGSVVTVTERQTKQSKDNKEKGDK